MRATLARAIAKVVSVVALLLLSIGAGAVFGVFLLWIEGML